jgi:hypothetical protein
VSSTFIKAIEAVNFVTWPRLTAQHVRKYLKKTEATIKGHLNQTSKNVRKTRPKKKVTTPDEEVEYEPHIMKRTNVVYAATHELEGHTYTNLTGRFPTTSSRGYKYILFLYYYDSNTIQAEPMKIRSDAEAIRAYTKIYDELTAKGSKPTFQTMDNEASMALKHFLHLKDIEFQLVAPQHSPTLRVDKTHQSISPPPRVETVQTRKFTTPRVTATLTPHPETTNDAHYRPQRSPQDHSPPQVTQEERAYQLIATVLPKIESAHAVTDMVTGRQLEYRHLLMRPYLKPILVRAFTDELERLAQGIRDVIGINTIEFIFTSEIPRDRTVTYGRLVCDI